MVCTHPSALCDILFRQSTMVFYPDCRLSVDILLWERRVLLLDPELVTAARRGRPRTSMADWSAGNTMAQGQAGNGARRNDTHALMEWGETGE